MNPVRTRFAPSPTGSLHVGGARTALYNYLFARKHGGAFVLRIEDTDIVRSTEASENIILEDLAWLGLAWDEGPNREGAVGPYRQSERLKLYERYKGILMKSPSLLYPCYCTEEELSAKRLAARATGRAPIYDGTCRTLSPEEVRKNGWQDRKFAWRLNVEMANQGKENSVTVHDLVRGDVQFDASLIGDFVVIKSNGTPSYNFACVIDDHEMNISHVIRGDEHLTNTPRQILLYQTLDWEAPKFAHLSMMLAPDHSKLSKRHGTTAVGEFRDKGYLPQAILNYIALLGWSPKDEREIFLPLAEYSTSEEALRALLKEVSEYFSLDGVSKNPAIFDLPKLTWMNSQYIRLLKPEALVPMILPLFRTLGVPPLPKEKLFAVLSTQRHNFGTLVEAVQYVLDFYLPGEVQLEESAKEILQWPWAMEVFAAFQRELRALTNLAPEAISPLMKRLQAETGKKGKELFWPIRVAVSGKTHGPELVHLLPILGKDEIIRRIDSALTHAVE